MKLSGSIPITSLKNSKALFFHSLTALITASLATLLFIGLMWFWPRFAGEGRFYLLYYHAPIGFAFVVYVFDRVAHRDSFNLLQWALEAAVVLLALSRTIWPLPFFSGHALFLTYAFATTPRPLVRWVTGLVLADVVYMKSFVLHDMTLIGGALLGIAFAGYARYWSLARLAPKGDV